MVTWMGISDGAWYFMGAVVLVVTLAVVWYRSDWDDADGGAA